MYFHYARLKLVAKSEIQINGVHGKGNSIEVFLEYVIESPCQISVYSEVFVSFPASSSLNTPLETT